MNYFEKCKQQLTRAGLKVTPQRLVVMEALEKVGEHPTADQIVRYISKKSPGISHATVYKTLDTFVEHGMLRKVKTEADKMRYDPVLESHHHLYCAGSDRIKDYYDEKLDELIRQHFKDKEIEGFQISDINLQIIGSFHNETEKSS